MKIYLLLLMVISIRTLESSQNKTANNNEDQSLKLNNSLKNDSVNNVVNKKNLNVEKIKKAQERNLRQTNKSNSSLKLHKNSRINKEMLFKRKIKRKRINRKLRRSHYGNYSQLRRSTQECMVTAEIFPLEYVQITRTAEVRITFESNCIPKKEIIFQYNFDDDKDADFNEPPSILNLKLFDNYYTIQFSDPKIWDNYDLMRTKYFSKAKFMNIQDEITMDLRKKATVFLTPQEYNTYSKYNLEKLSNLNQFFSCQIKKNMLAGWKVQAQLDYLRFAKYSKIKHTKKKTYKGVLQVEEKHNKFGALQKRMIMRNKKFRNKKTLALMNNYDYKTFFRDGKIWLGKNPYIKDIEMVCEIH